MLQMQNRAEEVLDAGRTKVVLYAKQRWFKMQMTDDARRRWQYWF